MSSGEKVPNHYQLVNCHMVFGIKMEDICRKACIVEGGHATHTPDVITYSSVVASERVWIALTMAALHDLKVKGADALRPYVMTPNSKKIWTMLGPEIGDDTDKSLIIAKALCNQKSAGASLKYILHSVCRS